jgi:UDP-glucose:(heptosyl)LPS alpha-1,3-glucosyltransferase
MKIAFVVHDYHQSGGHSRYVTELARRFSSEHEVHVFANGIHESGATKIKFHRVPAWRLSALTTIFTFLLPATEQVNGSFDIVHAQGLCSLRSDVVTAHICNRAWFEARRKNDGDMPLKEHLFDRLVSPLEKRLYKSAENNLVIAISEKTNRELARHYGRATQTTVIHHGVDINQFNPANRALYRKDVLSRSGLSDDDFVFLFVGDLRKGAIAAISAMGKLEGAKLEGAKLKLVLVSRTQPSRYRQCAEELGVGDRVIFCPPTDSIEQYYGAADAFVFPTPYDAFGMVISEAMAAGLPVITSREAGAAELITHQRNGLLLDSPADAGEIAECMKRLIADSEFCKTLGRSAREKMQSCTWDKVAEQTMEVYRQVVAGRSK